MSYKVTRPFTGSPRAAENEFETIGDVLEYVKGSIDSPMSTTITIERIAPKVFRKVARFTLLSFGLPASGADTQNKTAEEFATYYGYETAKRLQGYLESGIDYKVVVGQAHSVIPDESPEDTYAQKYSIRIDSITEEEVN